MFTAGMLFFLNLAGSVLSETPTPTPVPEDPRCLPPAGTIWVRTTTGDGDPTCGARYLFVESDFPQRSPQEIWQVVVCESPTSTDARFVCGACHRGRCVPSPPPSPPTPPLPTPPPTPPTPPPTSPTSPPTLPTPPPTNPTAPPTTPTTPTTPTYPTAPTIPTAPTTPPTAPTIPPTQPTQPTTPTIPTQPTQPTLPPTTNPPTNPSPPPTAPTIPTIPPTSPTSTQPTQPTQPIQPTPPLPPANCSFFDITLPSLVVNTTCQASLPFSCPPPLPLPHCPGCSAYRPWETKAEVWYTMVSLVLSVHAYDAQGYPVYQLPDGTTGTFSIPLQDHATLENVSSLGAKPSICQKLVAHTLICAWWNIDTDGWDMDGCHLSRDGPGQTDVGVGYCNCTHVDAFALILATELSDARGTFCGTDIQLEGWIFVGIFSFLFLISFLQTIRLLCSAKPKGRDVVLLHHLVLCVVCALRVLSVLLRPFVIPHIATLIAGVAQTLQLGQYTLICLVWASVALFSMHPKAFASKGMLFGFLVSIFAFVALGTPLAMVWVVDFDARWRLATIGASVMAGLTSVLLVAVVCSGLLLVSSINDFEDRDEKDPRLSQRQMRNRFRILTLATVTVLLLESVVWALSASTFDIGQHYLVLDVAYRTCGACGVLVMLYMFWSAVARRFPLCSEATTYRPLNNAASNAD